MTCRSLFLVLFALVGLVAPASANFIYLNAEFDGKTVGQPLGRGGAEIGEPTTGLHDTPTDEIVNVAPGNNAVRVEDSDNFAGSADFLYFTFADSRQLDSGRLTLTFEITPEIQDVYELQILGTGVDNYFGLEFDQAGFLYWRDDDDPAVNFDTYTVGTTYAVELIYDLDDYTYTFNLNGVNILTDESSGFATGAIEGMAIGNGFDGNNTGSCLIDNVRAVYRPGEANVLLSANFSAKPLGPIGTGGASEHEPVDVDPGAIATVENANPILSGKYLQIVDDEPLNSATVEFQLRDAVEVTTGSVCVSFVVSVDNVEPFFIHFYEQGGASSTFMQVEFNNLGEILLKDELSQPNGLVVGTYSVDTPLRMTFNFEMDYGLTSAWIDGNQVLTNRAHGIVGDGLGSIYFGHTADGNTTGIMKLDGLTVYHSGSATPAPPATPQVLASVLHPASPNPFNPTTTIRYELDRSAPVALDLFDVRGRHVVNLIDDHRSAGNHAVQWNGRDRRGDAVASGVYYATLRTPAESLRIKLVLSK